MNRLIYALPGSEKLAKKLAEWLPAPIGRLEIRYFPDGEAYVRAHTNPKGRSVILVADLSQPNRNFLPLIFAGDVMRDLGAIEVGLAAPYLPYMRQDKRFHDGEAISSASFARLVSASVDWMVTVDPHLHRRKSLSEIYSIPTTAVHAAPLIGQWIAKTVGGALLVGPDGESEQWVKAVAETAGTPFIVLKKIRRGDRDVEVSVPDAERWSDRTPVLVDDIISTARTMIETVDHLNDAGLRPPICIGVHALFAGDAYEHLSNSGIDRIVTCNSVDHSSNTIDLSALIADGIRGISSYGKAAS